jgi:hypothetical protein
MQTHAQLTKKLDANTQECKRLKNESRRLCFELNDTNIVVEIASCNVAHVEYEINWLTTELSESTALRTSRLSFMRQKHECTIQRLEAERARLYHEKKEADMNQKYTESLSEIQCLKRKLAYVVF